MTDIVERLRDPKPIAHSQILRFEAADEIERLSAERDALLKLTKKLWPEGLIGAVALETAGDVRLCFDSPMYANSFVRRMQVPIDASSKASSLDAAIDAARREA